MKGTVLKYESEKVKIADKGTVVAHYLLRNAKSLFKEKTVSVPIMYKVIDFSIYK